MANRNHTSGIAEKAISDVKKLQQIECIPVVPNAPFRYYEGDLGLGDPAVVSIRIIDSAGRIFDAPSVEWVLHCIDAFTVKDRTVLLMAAARHYGFEAYALMGADFDSINDAWDLLDTSGNVLVARVRFAEACEARDEYARRPGWVGRTVIQLARNDIRSDPRHEGRLVLLHQNLGVSAFTGVAVMSHVGRCGMMLEEALWRFDQFDQVDQENLMAGLTKHFDLDGAATVHQGGRA